jgi:hypothetical protein
VCKYDNEYRLLDKYGNFKKKFDSKKLHAVVDHLTPGVKYCITVTASNSKYEKGPPSKEVKSTTAEPGKTKPSPPEHVVATPKDAYSVKLTFDPPKCDGGCDIKNFIVHYEPIHDKHDDKYNFRVGGTQEAEQEFDLTQVDVEESSSSQDPESARFIGKYLLHKLKEHYEHEYYKPKHYEEPKHEYYEKPKHDYYEKPKHEYYEKPKHYPLKKESETFDAPKHSYGKISLIIHDLKPGVKYRFTVKTKTVCKYHPYTHVISHPSNYALAKTCLGHDYSCHPIGCGCKYGHPCSHC